MNTTAALSLSAPTVCRASVPAFPRHPTSKSLSENSGGGGGEGFWLRPRRPDRRIPAAGCNGRANEGPSQKTRRQPCRNFQTGSKEPVIPEIPLPTLRVHSSASNSSRSPVNWVCGTKNARIASFCDLALPSCYILRLPVLKTNVFSIVPNRLHSAALPPAVHLPSLSAIRSRLRFPSSSLRWFRLSLGNSVHLHSPCPPFTQRNRAFTQQNVAFTQSFSVCFCALTIHHQVVADLWPPARLFSDSPPALAASPAPLPPRQASDAGRRRRF